MDIIVNWDLYYYNNWYLFGNSFGVGVLGFDGKIYYVNINIFFYFYVVEWLNFFG